MDGHTSLQPLTHTTERDETNLMVFGLDEVQAQATRMARQLMGHFSAIEYNPPRLPSVAVKLRAFAQRPDAPPSALMRLLEQDIMLAARVMKLACAPFYAGPEPVRSLKDAVSRLGHDTLRSIVTEASMNIRIFRAPVLTVAMETLRRHSILTAHAARVVATHMGLDDPEEAFLCGLMHDVGIAGLLLVMAEAGQSHPRDQAQLWPAIDLVHEQASEWLCRHWALPETLQTICGGHHQRGDTMPESPMMAAVIIAEGLAVTQGASLVPDQPAVDMHMPSFIAATAESVGLDKGKMKRIREDLQAVLWGVGY